MPFILLVFGPFGTYVGAVLAGAIQAIFTVAPWLAGALMSGFWSILVLFGLHWPFVALAITSIATTGSDALLGAAGGATFASIGICIGVIIKAKDPEFRELMITALIPALFVGITEPILYGACLRYKRLLVFSIISAAVGGVICAMCNVRITATFFSILALNTSINWIPSIIAGAISTLLAIGLTVIFGFNEGEGEKAGEKKSFDFSL